MPSLDHPYAGLANGRWLRGNLHAHTTRSDGRHRPQELITPVRPTPFERFFFRCPDGYVFEVVPAGRPTEG